MVGTFHLLSNTARPVPLASPAAVNAESYILYNVSFERTIR